MRVEARVYDPADFAEGPTMSWTTEGYVTTLRFSI
jgi:hypothetical protein